MYKSIGELNPKIKKFQNLAILPGFDYNLEPQEKSNILKMNNTILKDKDVINDKFMLNFLVIWTKVKIILHEKRKKNHFKKSNQKEKIENDLIV